MSVNVADLFQPCENAVPVIDPELKHLGRVWIPFTQTTHTNGIDRYYSDHPHPPSLCLLFQQNRCHAAKRCNQIHVSRAFMKTVRQLLQERPSSNCCSAHGDLASQRADFRTMLTRRKIHIIGQKGNIPVPSERLAVTKFWNRYLEAPNETGAVSIPLQRVCHLHQRNECRYGVDCKNVHLCREMWNHIVATPLTPPRTSTTTSPQSVVDHRSHRLRDVIREDTGQAPLAPDEHRKQSRGQLTPGRQVSRPTHADLPRESPRYSRQEVSTTPVEHNPNGLRIDTEQRSAVPCRPLLTSGPIGGLHPTESYWTNDTADDFLPDSYRSAQFELLELLGFPHSNHGTQSTIAHNVEGDPQISNQPTHIKYDTDEDSEETVNASFRSLSLDLNTPKTPLTRESADNYATKLPVHAGSSRWLEDNQIAFKPISCPPKRTSETSTVAKTVGAPELTAGQEVDHYNTDKDEWGWGARIASSRQTVKALAGVRSLPVVLASGPSGPGFGLGRGRPMPRNASGTK